MVQKTCATFSAFPWPNFVAHVCPRFRQFSYVHVESSEDYFLVSFALISCCNFLWFCFTKLNLNTLPAPLPSPFPSSSLPSLPPFLPPPSSPSNPIRPLTCVLFPVSMLRHNQETSDKPQTLRVGSLVVKSLGQLLPHQLQSFHTRDAVYPVSDMSFISMPVAFLFSLFI